MESLIVASVMGWAFERTNIIMNLLIPPSLQNENAGFGAVEGTINRNTLAPACYRVLVPWAIWLVTKIFPKMNRSVIYQALRTLIMIYMFWAIVNGWNLMVAAIAGVIMVATIRYDYWDWPLEVAGIGMAMTGNLELCLTGSILAGLSRETAPLIPIVYFMRTGDWMGSLVALGVICAVMLGVRLYVGRRALHCKRVVLEININALLNIYRWQPLWNADIFITVVLTGMAIAAMFTFPVGWPVIPIVLVMSWVLAKYDEARTLVSVIPFIAAWLVNYA